MSDPNRKPHVFKGREEQPAMTQLKLLPAEDRAQIFQWATKLNQDMARAKISEHYEIEIPSNGILTRFCDFQLRQAPWDELAKAIVQDETAVRDTLPEISREKMREITLKRQYAIANATGDSELALNVVNTDIKDSKVQKDWHQLRLDREKFEFDAAEAVLTHAEKVREIAASNASHTEKIAQVKQIMFSDLE